MKKIIYLTIVFLFILNCNGQNIVPVEKAIDYKIAGKGIPANTYLKDINNLFALYIGTWKGTINNKTYTFFITKTTETNDDRTVDKLVIHHHIFDNKLGYTLEDTRLANGRPQIKGWFFSSDLKYYNLHYIGENAKCGRQGQVYIEKMNTNTMKLQLSAYSDYDFSRCPGGQMSEQVLPTDTPVILTKQ